MKAMQIDRFGGSEVFQLREVSVPVPGPGQVLIKVAYASVNPADWKGRAGLLGILSMFPFPLTMGMDAAGVVQQVGEGVTDFKAGDRVITLGGLGLGLQGTYAEFCCAPVLRVAPLPRHLTLAEGATLPIAGASAASSIVDVANAKAGDRVLVNGGAGSVGTFAIRFLRALGAEVAATCSSRNVEHVRGFGADLVIDYTRDAVLPAVRAWAPDGLDSVIDAVGQHSLPPETPDAIKPAGVLVAITNLLTGPEAFDLAAAERRGVRVLDNVMAAMPPDPTWFQVKAFRQLMEFVATGQVKPPPYKIMPLTQIGVAQNEVEAGHVRGKILLEIAGGE